MKIDCIVLAGGKGSRIREKGLKNKPFTRLEGRPLIAYVVETVKDFFSDIAIVTKNEKDAKRLEKVLWEFLSTSISKDRPRRGKPHTTAIDVIPDNSRIYSPIVGIKAGLAHLGGSHVFVVACDMPFLEGVTVYTLLNRTKPSVDCVVYKLGGRVTKYEPLCTVYSRRFIEKCKDDASLQKVIGKLSSLERVTIPVYDKMQFFNVNTLEDLIKAEKIMIEKKQSGK